jgi:hypothetical protein
MTTKERPILFSGPMVRAILDGRKTQTRRIVKGQPALWLNDSVMGQFISTDDHLISMCPYGKPGDRLWVRETFAVCADSSIFYRSDGGPSPWDGIKWKPSIHMPRAASRITLEIVSVRAELLHEITESDAIAEGCQCDGVPASLTNRGAFGKLWLSINGPGSWDVNPWVWVVEFRRCEQ